MTGQFKPFRGSHAIVEVVFFFEFAGNLVVDDRVKDRIMSAIADREWQYEPVKSFEVKVVQGNAPGVAQMSDGFQLHSCRPNSPDLAWQIRIHKNHVSLHCLEYSRWKVSSKSVQDYLSAIFTSIGAQDAPLRLFGMKVLDRFMYFGDWKDYSADALFNSGSRSLSASIFESGPRWHLYSGWFETEPGAPEEMLSQLNIDSSPIAPEDHRPNVAVTIDHTLSVKPLDSTTLGDQFDVLNAGLDGVFGWFEHMHTHNKKTVCGLLNSRVCDSMNMHID